MLLLWLLQVGPSVHPEPASRGSEPSYLMAIWQVLSDFIVENRGIVPKTLKSASDNIEQVNQIIKTSYPACTQPDPAGALLLPLVPGAMRPCHLDYYVCKATCCNAASAPSMRCSTESTSVRAQTQ